MLLEEEQHHTSSTSPLKYMQVSIDAMRVVAQETELRPNIKTQEEEIENDSSRDQEAAPTPDTQNKSMHSHPPIVLFTFFHRVVNSMSANDTTGALCAGIFYTASTSEHTPVSSILDSPDVESPNRSRKGNVMKLIIRTSIEK